MVSQRHVLQRGRIVVRVDANEREAIALQEAVRQTALDDLPAILAAVCDDLSPPDQRIRIDRIEVDLGTVSPDELNVAFRDVLRDKLREALAQHIAEDGGQPASERQFELLRTFARTGLLPWWAEANTADAVDAALLALAAHPQSLRALLAQATDDDTGRYRLASHATDDTLLGIVEAVAPTWEEATFYRTVQVIVAKAQALSVASPSRARHVTWAEVLRVFGEVSTVTSASTLTRVATRVEAQLGITTGKLLSALEGVNASPQDDAALSPPHTHTRGTLLEFVATLPGLPANDFVAAAQVALADASIPARDWEALHRLIAADLTLPVTMRQQWLRALSVLTGVNSSVEAEPVDTIYVSNSGLVILWPFLPTLFARVGLTQEGDFSTMDARQGGVALLQYLATGHSHLVEYQIPLNKLLCGLSPGTPVPVDIDLPDTVMTEADQLLEIVIERAPILGEMSIDGLRGSFLLRAGVLEPSASGVWSLRAEQQSYDVVLRQFPWSWDIVRLSWMPSILEVTW